jgi:endoglucanase
LSPTTREDVTVKRLIVLGLLVFTAAAEGVAAEPAGVFAANKALGRGVNLGNALEAPKEGAWGVTIEDGFFELVKKAGFDTVRLPVKWSAHAAAQAPFAIDADFYKRVDHLLDQAEKAKLNVVLNVHHFDELDKDPDGQAERFVGLWRQIAKRYQDRPMSVYFELNNEPHDKLDEQKWNDLLPRGLAAIRKSNPTRPVIVGPAQWNGIRALPKLKLPDDKNLIVTVHYYNPHEFTHQGATWSSEKVKTIKDRKWTGSEDEMKAMRKEFDQAAEWAKANKRPIFLGEFGAYEKAPMDSRVKWTAAIRQEAEARDFSWAYWEFGAGFGVYDLKAKEWRKALLEALISPEK